MIDKTKIDTEVEWIRTAVAIREALCACKGVRPPISENAIAMILAGVWLAAASSVAFTINSGVLGEPRWHVDAANTSNQVIIHLTIDNHKIVMEIESKPRGRVIYVKDGEDSGEVFSTIETAWIYAKEIARKRRQEALETR